MFVSAFVFIPAELCTKFVLSYDSKYVKPGGVFLVIFDNEGHRNRLQNSSVVRRCLNNASESSSRWFWLLFLRPLVCFIPSHSHPPASSAPDSSEASGWYAVYPEVKIFGLSLGRERLTSAGGTMSVEVDSLVQEAKENIEAAQNYRSELQQRLHGLNQARKQVPAAARR